jgi:hypothetical protein
LIRATVFWTLLPLHFSISRLQSWILLMATKRDAIFYYICFLSSRRVSSIKACD